MCLLGVWRWDSWFSPSPWFGHCGTDKGAFFFLLSQNSNPWFGHHGTNQGACFISSKFLPSVRPLRYRLRCMFNLSQNFVFSLSTLVQTKEYVAFISNFCPWFGHGCTNQETCYIFPKLSPSARPSRYESRSMHGSCKHGSFKCCVRFILLISVLVRSL